MATIAEIVDNAIRAAGIPIIGVTLGSENDRLTWSIQFDPSATAQQRTQAAGILASVAVDAPASLAQDRQDTQSLIDNMPRFEKAIALTLLDEINILRNALSLAPRTVNQALTAIRNKAATL